MLPCPAVNFSAARIIAFDNDGTLYPSGIEVGCAVLEAHRAYVREHGLNIPTPQLAFVQSVIGADAKDFYGAMLPGQPLEVVRDFEQFCLDFERQAVLRYPRMFDGAEELLAGLKAAGKTLLLVTNGPPRYVQDVWDTVGMGRFLAAAYPYGPPDFSTKGERLAQAVTEWGGGPAVMVGDRLSDLEAARAAGVPFIGAAYGYAGDGELKGADALAGNMQELYNLLMDPKE